MSTDDTGVTDLLSRATSGLTPDVARLVSGGIARGRLRRRRARIGTAVASLAVIGAVGGLAAVVPQLSGGADTARDPGVARGGATATPAPGPTETPTAPGESSGRQLRPLPAAQVPTIALSLLDLGSSPRVSDIDVHLDGPQRRVVRVRYDGMITEFGLHPSAPQSLADCERDARGVDGTCLEVFDGQVVLTWGPVIDDGVTCHGAALERGGHELYATSCNAAERHDSPPLAPEPPLSRDELVEVLASDYWFE
jgi:hypothetical protein